MSIIAKLQVLLLLTGIAVTVYMFFLYKEVRIFEKEIIDIKAQVASLTSCAMQHQAQQSKMSNKTSGTITDSNSASSTCPATALDTTSHLQQQTVVEQMEIPLEADDDVSVTSNEIKDILTNINDDEDDDECDNNETNNTNNNVVEQSEADTKSAVTQQVVNQSEKKTLDLTKLSEKELSVMKYDDIRAFLRQQGYNNKGSKNEYIQRVLEMGKQQSAAASSVIDALNSA